MQEEDKQGKETVEAKGKLESYAYQLKRQVNDKDQLGKNISEEDKQTGRMELGIFTYHQIYFIIY